MVATSTLLELTLLKRIPSYSYTQRYNHRSSFLYYKSQYKSNHVHLPKILCKYNKQPTCLDSYATSDSNHDHVWKNYFKQIVIPIKKALLDSLKKLAVASVLLGLLLFYGPNCALARSGGRIGGSAFSSRKSSSLPFSFCPSSSRSNSDPIKESEPSFMDSAYPWDGTENKTHEEIQQLIADDIRNSFVRFHRQKASDDAFWSTSFFRIATSVMTAFSWVSKFLSNGSKTSILRLQVGLLGSARTLQHDFNSLVETADTSTPEGLSYVLTEAVLALLRHPYYCISCYSSVDVKHNIEESEKQFNQLSIEERGKLDEETLVNVDNIKRQSSKIHRASDVSNEYIVVTILVAAEGVHKMQPIHELAELKKILQKLGSISRNQIMAIEVLWTPQDEEEAMSYRELLEDYPLLSPLSSNFTK